MSVSLCTKISRKKIINLNQSDTELKRALNVVDLTFLGIGSTVGVGVYVLSGAVARNDAGPAVTVSFLIAALTSMLAGLCYAEFGTRIPKAGSAYVYTYTCVGQLVAFIVGWSLILEYVIGVASIAKGYSTHLDAVLNGAMKDAFLENLPIGNTGFLSDHFDAFAFTVCMVITCILAVGVKESSLFNIIFTGIKLLVVVFIIIVGSIYAKPSNWAIDPSLINVTALTLANPGKPIGPIGSGGFSPFGIGGIMKGAATCFYAFVGFDCIATTGEEAKNPQRSIPLAFFFSLSFVFCAYMGISTVLTMMVPYYLQDEHAPLPEAFNYVGFETGKWIVSIGALVGFSASLLGVMFPLPRVIYAMASDGLLFKFLGKVHSRTKTPLVACIVSGSFGACMAAIFELSSLVDMMSIGTLTAYLFVSIGVLLLRYRADDSAASETQTNGALTWKSFVAQIFNNSNATVPTRTSTTYINMVVFIYCLESIAICALVSFGGKELGELNLGYLIGVCVIALLLMGSLVSLSFQPVSPIKPAFQVPLVPLVPGLSVLINTYLMMQLSYPTWIRFSVWLFLGLSMYTYCVTTGASERAYNANKISASNEHTTAKKENEKCESSL